MSRELQLKIVLDAVDKATRTLKNITKGNRELAGALKAASEQKKQLDKVQKNVSGFIKIKTSLYSTSKALTDAREKVRAMALAQKNGQETTAAWRKEFTKANETVRDLTNKSKELRVVFASHRKNLKESGFDTAKFADSQKKLASDIGNATAKVIQQKEKLAALNRQQERTRRMQAGAKQLHSAGVNTALHGAGAAYLGQRVGRETFNFLRPGIDYDTQISELRAVTRLTENDERLSKLKDQARLLGGNTAFSAHDAAAGQTFLARAGFTPQAILASMSDVLDLALGQKLELGRTADLASNISSAFKIDPEIAGNMTRVTDVLAATTTRTNVSLEMLGDTMKYLGQAEGLKVTLEESAALAGLLGNIGIQGSQAGTTLRAMLNRLSAPAKAGQKAMAEIGLQAADSAGNLRPITEVLDEIFKKTAGMGNVKRASILKHIFGDEAGSGMAELVNQQGSGALRKLINELHKATGESSKAARILEDNIQGDLLNLESGWEELWITITELQRGPLRETIKTVNDVVDSVAGWVKANPELAASIAKWSAIFLATITMLGIFGFVLGNAMIAVAGLIKVALALGGPLKLVGTILLWLGRLLLANPIGLLITAIAAGAYLIWKNWEPIKQWFSGLWGDVKAAFDQGIGGITKLLLDWSPFGLLYKGVVWALEKLGINLPEKFKTLGGAVVDGLLGGLFGGMDKLKAGIIGLGKNSITWFKDTLGIRSPSRIFAELGINTLQGYQKGLQQQQGPTLQRVGLIAKQVTAAGAGLVMSGTIAASNAAPGALQQQREPWLEQIKLIAKQATTSGTGAAIGNPDSASNNTSGVSPIAVELPTNLNPLQDYQSALQQPWKPWLKQITLIAKHVTTSSTGAAINNPNPVSNNTPGIFPIAIERPIDFTPPQGYQNALQQQREPWLEQIKLIAKQTATNNAGLAKSDAITPSERSIIKRPMAAKSHTGDTISITVHPSPGMDERAIAAQIERILQERERRKQTQHRANLFDND